MKSITPRHYDTNFCRNINVWVLCRISSSSLLSKNVKINIYRTIILPVVLYVCKSWSLTLREKCRPRVFENKVLRKMFGPKRVVVTGEWRRLHKG